MNRKAVTLALERVRLAKIASRTSGARERSSISTKPASSTPAAIVTRLNRAIVTIVSTPEMKERFIGVGVDPLTSAPAELDRYIVAEIAKWTKVIREAGIREE